MKEYIEREAAVRAAKDGADEWDGGCSRYRDASIESAMNAIPAADVVEVVRCGECMFWDAPPSCEGLARCQTGESGVRFRKAYDFCSRGRKMKEDDKT